MSDLVRLGDFETVNSLAAFDDRRRSEETRDRIAPDVRAGRYGSAAREAAAAGDTDLAQSLYQMDRADLSNVAQRGERGASALYSVLALPKEQRASFMAQHQNLAADAGITPEQFASFDWSNDAMVRAVADKWQAASRMAGEITLQRFGDDVHPVRSGPGGMDVLPGGVTAPETRAERRDDRRIAYAQDSDARDFRYRSERDAVDDDYRAGRAEADDAYRRWQMENPNSRGDIEGVVLGKAVRDGAAALSPEEKAIYDRYLSSGSSGGIGGYLTPPAPVAAAPLQPGRGGAPGRGGGAGSSQSAPARVASQEEFDRLPSGAWFVNPADGRTLQKDR